MLLPSNIRNRRPKLIANAIVHFNIATVSLMPVTLLANPSVAQPTVSVSERRSGQADGTSIRHLIQSVLHHVFLACRFFHRRGRDRINHTSLFRQKRTPVPVFCQRISQASPSSDICLRFRIQASPYCQGSIPAALLDFLLALSLASRLRVPPMK